MMRSFAAALILTSMMALPVLAGNLVAPEIDSYSATAAMGLIGGAVLLIRSRKKK
jgi:hypothetical protein